MFRKTHLATLLFLFLASCGGIAGERTMVDGTGPDDMLKLRAGPGLGYSVVLGLPDGTQLIKRDCVTELGQLWCEVSLSAAPRVTGYVSADYLSER